MFRAFMKFKTEQEATEYLLGIRGWYDLKAVEINGENGSTTWVIQATSKSGSQAVKTLMEDGYFQ